MYRQTAAGAEAGRPLCAASRLHIVWSRETTGAQAPGAPAFPKGGQVQPQWMASLQWPVLVPLELSHD